MIERVMILDAVLADKRHTRLGTERDKLAYFKASLNDRFRQDRHLTQAAARLSEEAFRAVWDNSDDAEYDRL